MGEEVLSALTNFVNLVVNGRTPPAVHSTFFGASLITLEKIGGGVRPIAVGHTLQRLAAKCLCSRVLKSVVASLSSLQLGCSTPNVAEAVGHAARLFIHNIPDDHLLLNLDFKNAFNS